MNTLGITVIAVAGLILVGVVVLLLVRASRGRRHRLTRPELRKRALRESERLRNLVDERGTNRPSDDPVIVDHELAHRRVTLYDEETRELYRREHLPAVAELREQFAGRGVRNGLLDDLYENAGNEADLRTLSTALEEMAHRLR